MRAGAILSRGAGRSEEVHMGRRKKPPLVPEAQAALQRLREQVAPGNGRNTPPSPMVELFRARARAFMEQHPNYPS